MATDIEDLVIAEYKNYGLVEKLKFPLWDCEWKMEPHKKNKKKPQKSDYSKAREKRKAPDRQNAHHHTSKRCRGSAGCEQGVSNPHNVSRDTISADSTEMTTVEAPQRNKTTARPRGVYL